MVRIKISCKEFNYKLRDVKDFLKGISSGRFSKEAGEILDKIEKSLNLNEQDIENLRKIYFLYCKEIREQMVNERHWHIIGTKGEAKQYECELKKIAKSYGEYRYDKDFGWLGVYAENKVKEFFQKLKLPFTERKNAEDMDAEERNWTNRIDRYDIKILNKTIDVKCATQSYYIEITPKVKVENVRKKDIYIATKFFDDEKLYLIGFFYHENIVKFPEKQLYGAKYYGVPLYNAKCFEELLNSIKTDGIR